MWRKVKTGYNACVKDRFFLLSLIHALAFKYTHRKKCSIFLCLFLWNFTKYFCWSVLSTYGSAQSWIGVLLCQSVCFSKSSIILPPHNKYLGYDRGQHQDRLWVGFLRALLIFIITRTWLVKLFCVLVSSPAVCEFEVIVVLFCELFMAL